MFSRQKFIVFRKNYNIIRIMNWCTISNNRLLDNNDDGELTITVMGMSETAESCRRGTNVLNVIILDNNIEWFIIYIY